jgi:hypothetical protein
MFLGPLGSLSAATLRGEPQYLKVVLKRHEHNANDGARFYRRSQMLRWPSFSPPNWLGSAP